MKFIRIEVTIKTLGKRKMADMDVLTTLLTNPQFVALIIAIIWNIAGYVAAILHVKGLEKYDAAKLAETFVLFEGLFTILATVAGLPLTYTAAITIVLVFIRSLQKAFEQYAQPQTPAPAPA